MSAQINRAETDTFEISLASDITSEHAKKLLKSGKYSDLTIECSDTNIKFQVHKFLFSMACPNLDLSKVDMIRANVPRQQTRDVYNLLTLVYTCHVSLNNAKEAIRLKTMMASLGCWKTFLPKFKHIPKFMNEPGESDIKVDEDLFEFFQSESDVEEDMQDEDQNNDNDVSDDFVFKTEETDVFHNDVSNILEQSTIKEEPKVKLTVPVFKEKQLIEAERSESKVPDKMSLNNDIQFDDVNPRSDYYVVEGKCVHWRRIGIGCPKCEKVWRGNTHYTKENLIKEHIRKVHPEMEEEKLCELILSLPKSIAHMSKEDEAHPLLRAMPSNWTKSMFECPHCPSKYATFIKLREHFLTWHKDKEIEILDTIDKKPYKCELCPYKAASDTNMKEHVKTQHTNDQIPCDTCGKIYKSKNQLKKHIQLTHEELDFQCEHCNKKYPTKYRLEAHLKVHYDIRDYTCEFCGQKFVQKQTLEGHRKKVHLNERNFPCLYCEKKFHNNAGLKRHTDAVHLNNKEHKCFYCDFHFADTGNRAKHMAKAHGHVFERFKKIKNPE